MTTADAERVEREEQLVAFHMDAETYGIDIAMIQEIIRLPEITPLPRASADVEGVINLRGRIVPVVNLRSRLGLEPRERPASARVIVVEVPEGTVGLIVDGVNGVLCLPASSIEAPSELVRGVEEDHIRGVGKSGDKLIILLQIASVLRRRAAGDGQDAPEHSGGAGTDSANSANRKAA